MAHHRNHKLVQHSIGNASSILSFYSVLDGEQLIEIITTTTNNDKYKCDRNTEHCFQLVVAGRTTTRLCCTRRCTGDRAHCWCRATSCGSTSSGWATHASRSSSGAGVTCTRKSTAPRRPPSRTGCKGAPRAAGTCHTRREMARLQLRLQPCSGSASHRVSPERPSDLRSHGTPPRRGVTRTPRREHLAGDRSDWKFGTEALPGGVLSTKIQSRD